MLRMKFFKYISLALIICLYFLPQATIATAKTEPAALVFAVFAYLGHEQTYAKYRPLVDYLNDTLPDLVFELKVLSQKDIEAGITHQNLDIVTTNPAHFTVIRQQMSLTGVIATLVSRDSGKPLYQLGGAIIVRADNTDIHTLQDIRGKVIATPSTRHMGGYRAQAYELFRAGIRLPTDVAEIMELHVHQYVVQAILAGEADVGFVRDGILESMIDAKVLSWDEIRIIAEQTHVNFPYRISTRLYPEWPVFALSHVEESAVRRVASALFALSPEHPAAIAANIHGYTIPGDYMLVEEASRTLRLPPFDDIPDFTWFDAWERWQWYIVIASASLALVVSLSILLAIALRRLRDEHAQSYLLMRSLAEGVYGTDRHGDCTFINPAALAMLGFHEQEVLGRDQHALFHYHDQQGNSYPPEKCPIFQTLADGKQREMDEYFIRKDGSTFPVHLKVAPLYQGSHLLGCVVIFRDLSIARARDSILRAEGMRLRAIYDVLPVGITITDPEGHIIDCNPASEIILGLSRAQQLARDFDSANWEIYRPDGSLMPADEYASVKALRENRPIYDTLMQVKTPHATRWLSVNAMPVEHELFGVVIAYTDVTASRQAQMALQASEEKYRALIDQSIDAIYLHDAQGRFIDVNQQAMIQTGYNKAELLAMSVFDIDVHATKDAEEYKRLWNSFHADDKPIAVESVHRRKDGTTFPIEINVGQVSFGGRNCFLGIVRDISERKRTDQEIRDAHQRLLAILDNIEAIIYVADMDTYEVLFANRHLHHLGGMKEGQLCWQSLQSDQTKPCHFCTNAKLVDAQGQPTGVYRWEHHNTRNGRWYDCRDIALKWIDGRIVRLEIATDITERKQLENRLLGLATIDGLTGLYRRETFIEQMEQALLQQTQKGIEACVMLMDLDHFKQINDQHGHAAGDEILRIFARILKSNLRKIDTAGRLGGEEFAALLPGTHINEAIEVATRLRKELEQVKDPLRVTVSIGVTVIKDSDTNSSFALARADKGLYRAKHEGRNRVIACLEDV